MVRKALVRNSPLTFVCEAIAYSLSFRSKEIIPCQSIEISAQVSLRDLACVSPATAQIHQSKTLAKTIRLVTRAASMPALHTSRHSRAAGGRARWPGLIRQQALLYSTRAQEMDSRHRAQQ